MEAPHLQPLAERGGEGVRGVRGAWRFTPAIALPRKPQDVFVESCVRAALLRLNPTIADRPARMANHESIRHSAKVNSREHVRLLFETRFPGVLQTMVESNFDFCKRITDSAELRRTVIAMLFDQVYGKLDQFVGG